MPSTRQDVIDGVSTSVAIKPPVKAICTLAVTAFGEQTVTGVAGDVPLVSGDRALRTADGVANGIYIVRTTTWERAQDWDGARDVVLGTRVYQEGTRSGMQVVGPTTKPIRIGTDLVVFESFVDPAGELPPESSILSAADTLRGDDGFNIFNKPSVYSQLAQAIASGAATVVIVSDSLGYGAESSAFNSFSQRVERRLRRLYPACVFTFKNRSIPGAKLTNFNDAAYFPAAPMLVLDGLGYPGYHPWSPDTDEEHSIRWPEGASAYPATAWKTVVANDAPDLIILSLGFNDIIGGARSLSQYRQDVLTFAFWSIGLAKIPSVCVCTEHTGNPNNPNTVHFNHRKIRGMNQIIRASAMNVPWGLIDAGRQFDMAMYGRDSLRWKVDLERYMDGVDDPTLWVHDVFGAAASANPITGAGTNAVTIDSTGKHGGAATQVWSRAVECVACCSKFFINKLATTSDSVFWIFDSEAPDGPATNVNKMFVRFTNDAGMTFGLATLTLDNVVLFTAHTPLFSTTGAAAIGIVVAYDGFHIRIWFSGNNNPNVPDIVWPAIAHAPGYPGIGYFNLAGAPEVTITKPVIELCSEAPVVGQGALETAATYFGTGVTGTYNTANRYGGGDTASHPSDLGYELLYEGALQPMLGGIVLALELLNANVKAAIQKNAGFTVTGAVLSRLVVANFAAHDTIMLPGPASGIAPGAWFDVMVNAIPPNGVVNFAPLDGTSIIIAERGAQSLVSQYQVVRVKLEATLGGTNRWMIYPKESVIQFGGISSLLLGQHFDGANWVADEVMSAAISTNAAKNRIETYMAPFETPGNLIGPAPGALVDFIDGAQYGQYTPLVTLFAGMTAFVPSPFKWCKRGNVVTVSGQFSAINAAANTLGTTYLSLPPQAPSLFATTGDCSGVASPAGVQQWPGAIGGDPVTSQIKVLLIPTVNTAVIYTCIFQYNCLPLL